MNDPAAGQSVRLMLDLPAGNYRAEWTGPISGKVEATKVPAILGHEIAGVVEAVSGGRVMVVTSPSSSRRPA